MLAVRGLMALWSCPREQQMKFAAGFFNTYLSTYLGRYILYPRDCRWARARAMEAGRQKFSFSFSSDAQVHTLTGSRPARRGHRLASPFPACATCHQTEHDRA
jgi:cytochrome c553